MRRFSVVLLFACVALILSAFVPGACGQTPSLGDFALLHDFSTNDGGYGPTTPLVLGQDGNFYGTTPHGGTFGYGAIYSVSSSGVIASVYSFGGGVDGSNPSRLTQGPDGNFYGTTSFDGPNGTGTVFSVTPAGMKTTLYSFSAAVAASSFVNADGAFPYDGVTLGPDGSFYGTTSAGGTNARGIFYKITPGGEMTVIHSFALFNEGDGGHSRVVLGKDGIFYGTTPGSSSTYPYYRYTPGTVFSITTTGTVSLVHIFADSENIFPGSIASFGVQINTYHLGTLIQGSDGHFYGTSYRSHDAVKGAVYSMTPDGVVTTVHDFTANDGGYPNAELFQDGDGNLYGTSLGDPTSAATAFRLTTSGSLTVLHTFADASGDGQTPLAGLVQGNDSNFYGTTSAGGSQNFGTIFSVAFDGTESVVGNFLINGAYPVASLIEGKDGNFYGTTGQHTYVSSDPSAYNADVAATNGIYFSTIFSVTPSGILTVLHRFNGSDGVYPEAAMLQASDGNFYGTTYAGGTINDGTIYKLTPAGEFTTLHSFTGKSADGITTDDGAYPVTSLVEGKDGNLYGTTSAGGTSYEGVVFRVTPTGGYSIVRQSGGVSNLVLGDDGNFYGTSETSIYRLTPAGDLTNLFSFETYSSDYKNSALIKGSDGNFYGTAHGHPPLVVSSSPTYQNGLVYKITPDGVFTAVYDFGPLGYPYTSNPAGYFPQTPLVLGHDGNFYGSTSAGGTNGYGTVFQLTPAGALTFLFSLGTDVTAGLLQGSNDKFYGTSKLGGVTGYGLIFDFTVNSGEAAPTPTPTPTPVQPPTITSMLIANGLASQPFSYQITADNAPTSYAANGLPTGLNLDVTSGLITGTLTQAGTFNITLTAFNSGGSGTATLTLTVASAVPVVTASATTPETMAGSGKKGVITLNLSTPADRDLVINYTVKGSAANGVDYAFLKGTKKFKAGTTTKVIKIKPAGNSDNVGKKTVKIILAPGDGYTIGTPGKIKVGILP